MKRLLTLKAKAMKNSTAVVICVFVAAGCIVSLGLNQIVVSQNSGMALWIRQGRIMPEALSLKVQTVSENSSYCNVALSIVNCSPSSTTLDKIQMEGTSALTFINGTEIINPSQMTYNLRSGGTVQVNLIIPNANYASNASITVYTPDAMYYTEASAT